MELKLLGRESRTGRNHRERIKNLKAERDSAISQSEIMKKQWQKEKEIAEKICEARQGGADKRGESINRR